ncbi:glycosyltransferase family 2 protein [Winogradskyella sp.]|uniref:glycosyltransferase family 2 protein n=1 Tax=Winogradskyella sp. TaxID=1883156 RepID=UPI003F6D7C45
MLFQFLKYIQPTNYFTHSTVNHASIFPVVEFLEEEIKIQLQVDKDYQSNIARGYDLSWQAVQLGYIGNAKTYKTFEEVPLGDEYRFIRKYFNSVWALYILVLRLFSFKNPVKNIVSYVQTRNTKRSNLHSRPIKHLDWKSFESQLIQQQPLVSVIIPTLNRYKYLKDGLRDLVHQDYKNFEVIVIDQSQPFHQEFYGDFNLNLTVKYQEELALWSARNNAIKLSKGEYILLYDDDSRVETDWITNHLKCIDYFNADISSGVSISVVGDKVPENYSFFRRSDQLDTGNVMLKKSIFKTIGLFDRQFEKQRMGDGEFGLRAHVNGFLNISNPFAKRLHLKVGSGGLREMGSWDGFRPKKWLDPRPIPSVLYLYRLYFGDKRAKLELLKTVPKSIMPYRYKGNKFLMFIGAVLSVFMLPIILFQVNKSWRLATDKIEEGPLIEALH